MNQTIKELVINGETYIRKVDAESQTPAVNTDGLPCVIVSCGSNGGGMHFGFLKEKINTGSGVMGVTLLGARRIQYWDGAASMNELATRGVSKPANCRFAPLVPEITLPSIVEMMPVSTKAQANLFGVPVWTK